jgi:Concanavalin A-like lectin/glucanases superfamily
MARAVRLIALAAICALAVTASASAATTHYWHGDGSAADGVGSANGSIQGSVTYGPGVLGQAFVFDGSNSLVDFGNQAGNFGTGDATISLWVKTSANYVMGLLSKRPECDNGSMWDIRADPIFHQNVGGTWITEFDDGIGDYNGLVSTGTITDGAWHHLTVVRSGPTVTTYVDGAVAGTGTTSNVDNIDNTADLLLGWSPCTFADATQPFSGSLDEISMSDVASPPYAFTGFFAPVDNGKLNVVQAGRAIPVKFSLSGYQGPSIFAAGSPSSHQVSCTTSDPLDTVEQTVTAGGSSLSYDATTDQYNYVWKTDKTWAGTCRELDLAFAPGGTHTALFKFTK